MHFLDLTLPTPEENLALDEALLEMAETVGLGEWLRIWEITQYVVVLGKNCRADDEVQIDRCRNDGVPVLRRVSGGGTVLLGPGCLNYSAILHADRLPGLKSVTSSFAYCLETIRSAIAQCGLCVEMAGTDLIWQQRKFSGNAQRRLRSYFLHHGTIIYRFNIPAVSAYVKEPVRQPPHRNRRNHISFLTNLPIEPDALSNSLRSAWRAHKPAGSIPLDLTGDLVRSRYSSRDWNFRQ